MAGMIRWSPFRMARRRDALDRLFDEMFYRPWEVAQREAVGLVPVDIYETADEYVIRATVPGVTADNLDVDFEAGVLTIRGEVREEKEVQGECICQERSFGKFARSISLPGDVQGDKIAANLKDGVLTVRVPKAEAVKPKKVAVKVE